VNFRFLRLSQSDGNAPSSVPPGVTVIAIVFFLAAAYLGLIGVVMLASPGAVSMALGTPLLGGLELAGPYMFLLTAGAAALIGLGLLRLSNWARRAAIAVAFLGVLILVPAVSAAAVDFRASLVWGGLGIIVRVIIIWYLFQAPAKETFAKD
jgi:multidrug transporter EmrE-like cation transporter